MADIDSATATARKDLLVTFVLLAILAAVIVAMERSLPPATAQTVAPVSDTVHRVASDGDSR